MYASVAFFRGRNPAHLRRSLRHRACKGHQATFMAAWLAAGATFAYISPIRADEMKSDTLETVKHASVMVFTAVSKREKGDTKMGSGSGFFINATGLAITNNHVVDPTHMKSPEEKQKFHYSQGRLTWTVITDSGTGEESTWDADVIYQNEAADQALLQVFDEEGNKLKWPHYLTMLPESRLKKRIKVWALGFPGGDAQRRDSDKHPEVSVTTGNVLELPRTPGGRIRMIYTDVVARPGNSGGPMVDQDGFLIGTVTLMKPPEGREDTGGAKYSSLVPGELTAQMVRNALDLEKITSGTDVTPFMDILTGEDGRIVVPEFKRWPDRDVLYYEDGDRIYGAIATKSITWNSTLGKLEVPTDAIAYVMANEEGANLFLEGGNRISSAELDSTFQFKPEGGSVNEQRFSDVGVVGFRTTGRSLEPVTGEVLVLDTEVCHLVLSDIRGTTKFKSRAGTIDVPIADIVRFDTESSGRQVLKLTDGRRLTGEFETGPIDALIAATRTPIRFDLSNVESATFEVVEMTRVGVAGLSLTGVLASADRDVRRIARILESSDPSGARARLDPLMNPTRLKKAPDADKDQMLLLDAVAKLREGQAKTASKAFRKCLRASDENIAAYAQAGLAVLKHYKDFQFEGKPLSDRATFIAAGNALASKRIQEVRDLLKDAEDLEGQNRGEYVKAINAVKKQETAMTASALFAGVEADDELIRLWKFAFKVCEQEIRRIDTELDASSNKGRRGKSRRGPRGRERAERREQEELNQQKEEALQTRMAYGTKLMDYGFRIEDPDIREFKEKQDEDDSHEGP